MLERAEIAAIVPVSDVDAAVRFYGDTLEQVRDGQVEVGFRHEGLEELFARLDHIFNRLVVGVIVAGGLVGSSLLGILATGGPQIFGLHFLSVIGFLVSGIMGIWLVWGILRSGRL